MLASALVATVRLGRAQPGGDVAAACGPQRARPEDGPSSPLVSSVVLPVLRPRLGVRRAAPPFIVAFGPRVTGANRLRAFTTTPDRPSIAASIESTCRVVTMSRSGGLRRKRLTRRQLGGAVPAPAGMTPVAAA